jgi:SWI/SNF-related matrix-associated actin-dependent regulator of chromatin subfamily A3
MQSIQSDVFLTTDTSELSPTYAFDWLEAGEQSYTPSTFTPPGIQQASQTWNLGLNEITCFGSVKPYLFQCLPKLTLAQIIDVKVQISNINRLKEQELWPIDSAQSFTVLQYGDYFALEYNEQKFAWLNNALCSSLRPLITGRQVRIQAFMSSEDWTTVLHSCSTETPTVLVEINIYGSRADAEFIGSTLSKSGIFLQWPRYGLDGVAYYNPHIFRIEGYSDQIPIEILPSPAADIADAPDRSVDEETRLNDSSVVDSILDSLSHRSLLHEISVDHRIRTILLP